MKISKYLLFAVLFYIPQSFADVQSISKKCASSFFKMQETAVNVGKQVVEKTSQVVGQAKQIAQNPKPALNQAKETAVASAKKGRQITASAVEQATGMAKQAGSAVANQTKQAVQDPKTALNQVKETAVASVEKGRQITASAVEQATDMAKQAGSAVAKQTKQTVQDPKTALNQARETASTGAEKGKQIAVSTVQGATHAVIHPKETLENAMQATSAFAGQVKEGFEQARNIQILQKWSEDHNEFEIDHQTAKEYAQNLNIKSVKEFNQLFKDIHFYTLSFTAMAPNMTDPVLKQMAEDVMTRFLIVSLRIVEDLPEINIKKVIKTTESYIGKTAIHEIMKKEFDRFNNENMSETYIRNAIKIMKKYVSKADLLEILEKGEFNPLFKDIISEMSLANLKLSPRVSDLLEQHEIDTVEKLKSYSDSELLAISGLGPKALEEVKSALIDYEINQMTTNLELSELAINPKILSILKTYEVKSITQLIQHTPEELLKMKQLGPKALEEIRNALTEKGLRLAGGGEPANVHTNLGHYTRAQIAIAMDAPMHEVKKMAAEDAKIADQKK